MSSPSVLVVDDDEGAVETLTDILTAKQYRVEIARSGEDAISLARTTPFDAILMDIVMPGVNGVEALRSIKAVDPATNVIMMTAYTRHELVEQARKAKAVAVLPKPLDMDRLLALLARTVRKNGGSKGKPR